jgi:pyrimidine-nucleoside phosphorylase
MRIVDLIHCKRDGEELSKEQIEFFLQGYLKGEIPDYQAAALLMAVYFTGLTDAELVDWTEGMARLASPLDLSDLSGPKLGKQSTGGVGDKTSLIVGPLVAAADITVPMVAARGTSYTGGTLDKIQSVPGFNAMLSSKDFKTVLKNNGLAIIGETEELAPADRKLSALRDSTGTAESIPLIVASLLSRTLAEGIDGVVMDVKTGSGSLIRKMTDSRRLAQSLLTVAKRMNKKAVCVISDMDQPLGNAIGNALEVMEAVESMRGNGPADVVELSLELAARMVCLAFPDRNLDGAKEQVFKLLGDGSALKKFRQMIEVQGGNPQVVDSFELLPNASADFAVNSPRAGFISRISADDIGQATALLGAGRDRIDAEPDFAVGIVLEHKIGDRVQAGERLCTIYYNDEAHLEEASQMVEDAFHISANTPEARPLVYEVLQ